MIFSPYTTYFRYLICGLMNANIFHTGLFSLYRTDFLIINFLIQRICDWWENLRNEIKLIQFNSWLINTVRVFHQRYSHTNFDESWFYLDFNGSFYVKRIFKEIAFIDIANSHTIQTKCIAIRHDIIWKYNWFRCTIISCSYCYTYLRCTWQTLSLTCSL